MASAFGDQSYSKLPPIRKGSNESQHHDEGKETDSSHLIDFNREGHGLVRLPPIIRVDSSLNTTKQRESPTSVICSENKDSFVSSRRLSTDLTSKRKLYSSQSDLQLHEARRADEKRKLDENTTNDSSDNYTRDSHLVKSDTHGCTIPRLEIDTFWENNLNDSKATSLLNTRQVDRNSRRASLIAAEPQKLHRSRRLAKSSPELSSTRKKYNSPIKESKVASKGRADVESIAASCSASDSKNEQLQFDISVNISSKDQESPRSPRNGQGRGIARRTEYKHKASTKGDFLPYSSPSTPVVHLMSDDNLSPRGGRQSLGDINNILSPQRARKTSIVSTRKKIPIRDELKKESALRVDGKTCPKNERLTSRATSSFRPHQMNKDGFLRPPESRTKRDSLYDLQQILSMLNTEDKSSNPSDSSKRENRSSSVYDLQEFLKMSSFGEQPASVTSNSKQSKHSSVGAESLLVPRLVEPGNRRGSTYELLEFLNQLNLAAAKTKGPPGKGSENTTVGQKQTENAPFLSPGDSENTSTQRRPSAYDLMEFLSLSRGSQNEETTNTDGTSQTQPVLKLRVNAGSEQGETRKASVYNLEEFLGIPKNVPTTGSMVCDSEATPTPNTPLLSPNFASKFKFKRESIYDLQEFLGILQKETDGKQNSSQATDEDKKTSKPIEHPGMEHHPGKEHTDTLSGAEPQKNRSLSIYDLREFLSMHASQSQSQSQSRGRKASSISQTSIMINVSEDEFGNGSVDDVFLAVPVEGALARKRSSVSELSELLNILNDPSRKRIHSNVSSAKSTSSERSSVAPPSPVSRHDSSGAKSLYDLGEFLSVLNSDDSPLRRRLSSVSDRGNCTPSGLSRHDSSGGSSLYDLEEFLTILNDNGKEENESMEENNGQEICIPVPQLPSRSERNGSERMTLVKRTSLTALNSLPESTDIVGKAEEGRRKSLGHCL
ncbi:uncharacterized protein LOC116301231 [Actinia tenebrosa]|uniref:Uncharacterized protein LOC116301231 n=1 Tax=Actinia tenebrosa TaxID=6105 RepID=A0A6P8IHB9_ACTTE|nr:uncharacterized protein LOC116301231 [Actinia tenebrosa]